MTRLSIVAGTAVAEGRRPHPRGHEPYGDDNLARRPYGPQPGPSGRQQEAVREEVLVPALDHFDFQTSALRQRCLTLGASGFLGGRADSVTNYNAA
jgi:hypothetical protein